MSAVSENIVYPQVSNAEYLIEFFGGLRRNLPSLMSRELLAESDADGDDLEAVFEVLGFLGLIDDDENQPLVVIP